MRSELPGSPTAVQQPYESLGRPDLLVEERLARLAAAVDHPEARPPVALVAVVEAELEPAEAAGDVQVPRGQVLVDAVVDIEERAVDEAVVACRPRSPIGIIPPPRLRPGVNAVAEALASQSPAPMTPSRNGRQLERASTTTPKARAGIALAVMTFASRSPSSSTYRARDELGAVGVEHLRDRTLDVRRGARADRPSGELLTDDPGRGHRREVGRVLRQAPLGIGVPAVDDDAGGEHEGHEGEREHRDDLAALRSMVRVAASVALLVDDHRRRAAQVDRPDDRADDRRDGAEGVLDPDGHEVVRRAEAVAEPIGAAVAARRRPSSHRTVRDRPRRRCCS